MEKPYRYKGGQPVPDDHWENDALTPRGDPRKRMSKEAQASFDARAAEAKAALDKVKK